MAVHVLHSVYLEPSWERARTQDDQIINNTASGHIVERWKWCWIVALKAHCDTIFMHLFSHLLGMFLKRLHWLTQSGKALQNSMQKHVETGCLNAPLMLIAPHIFCTHFRALQGQHKILFYMLHFWLKISYLNFKLLASKYQNNVFQIVLNSKF